MTVDEMMTRMSWAEFVSWNAYLSDSPGEQKPEQIKNALQVSLAAGRKKKR
jgi:hypothetical protein